MRNGNLNYIFMTIILPSLTHVKEIQNERTPRKLLDQIADAIRRKHYSYRTKQTYVQWIKRFIPSLSNVSNGLYYEQGDSQCITIVTPK